MMKTSDPEKPLISSIEVVLIKAERKDAITSLPGYLERFEIAMRQNGISWKIQGQQQRLDDDNDLREGLTQFSRT